MNTKAATLLKFVIVIMMVVVTGYVTIACLNEIGMPAGYENLFLLPISFLAMSAVYYHQIVKKQILDNIPNLIVITFLFLRNVVTPFIMIRESYVSSLGIASEENARAAILLTTYETIVVSLFLAIRARIRIKPVLPKLKERNHTSKLTFWSITIVLLLICVLAVSLLPQLRTHYFSVFTSGYEKLEQEDVDYKGNFFIRLLGHGGDIFIGAMRYVLPIYIMYALAKRKNSFGHFLFSIFLVIPQAFFMTDSNAYIVMLMISQMLFLSTLYPNYRKVTAIGAFCFGAIFMGIIYANRFQLNHYSKSLSLFLQSYIPNIANTAGIYNLTPKHSVLQIFTDIFVGIPFKNIIFGYTGNTMSINGIWQLVNDCPGQILSTVGESYYYFGSILSPALSCFFINIAYRTYKRMQYEDNALMYGIYIYLAVYAAVTPFMYNGCIFVKGFLQRILFMMIIGYFSPYKRSDLAQRHQR